MLFYSPGNLQILTRRFYYDHPAREDRKYITEELTFQNTGNKEIGEIILEIDGFRDNLKISDKNNIHIVYLPKYEIIKRTESKGELSQDMINKVRENEIYLLWIILNEPLLPGQQQILSMKYVKQPGRKGKRRKWSIFLNENIKDKIIFYDNETITISANWAEGLSVEKFPIFAITKKEKILSFLPSPIKSSIYTELDNIILLQDDTIHFRMNKESHFFQYSISQNLKIKYDIDFIYHTYFIAPEKDETYLIISLLMFILLFPFTELLFLILHLNSIPHLFDILEVEVVLILTTSFAQLRTKFINYRIWTAISIIVMAALFVTGLVYLL